MKKMSIGIDKSRKTWRKEYNFNSHTSLVQTRSCDQNQQHNAKPQANINNLNEEKNVLKNKKTQVTCWQVKPWVLTNSVRITTSHARQIGHMSTRAMKKTQP